MTTRSTARIKHTVGLGRHLESVHRRVLGAVDDPRFHDHQRQLLVVSVERAIVKSGGALLSHPLGTMLLLARAHRRLDDEATARVGAFCLLYVLALDLFDDVQDDDLEGKPHEQAGAPIAINSAITLSFLANRELHDALPHLDDDNQRRALLAIADRTGLAAVAGQHRDLMGSDGAATPEEVLAMQQGKTSSVGMLAELGALLGGANETVQRRYRRVGQQLAQLVQVRDDLRDVFGKAISPDLATGKITYPLACYLETASDEERQELLAAIAELAHSTADSAKGMDRVRRLLYQRGAVQRAAEQLERSRHAIHTELGAVPAAAPGYLRLVLDIVDGLASGVYVVPELAPSAALRCPGRGPFATRVLAELDELRGRLTSHGLPTELPALLPWHQPHWMYSPDQHAIFFPDIDDLGDEILPFQAALLGSDDLEEPRRLLTAQVPLVLAHEMFHFWRDAAGRLTDDHWHEEHAANALAVAYAQEHEPEALTGALQLAHQVIATSPDALDDETDRLLEDCRHPRVGTEGYGMAPAKVAVVGLEMVRRLATGSAPLDDLVTDLLGPASPRELSPRERKAAS